MFLQDTPPVTESYITAPRAEQTVPRSAASTTVLSAEDLRRTGERTLPRMIAKAAGVGTFLQETNTGGGAPILRGLIGERVLIVVDGVRLNDGTTRTGPNQSLNTIDPAIVERVEVVRGPASVLYGSDAVGGAVLIWTKRRAPGSARAGLRALMPWPRPENFQIGKGTGAIGPIGNRASLSKPAGCSGMCSEWGRGLACCCCMVRRRPRIAGAIWRHCLRRISR